MPVTTELSASLKLALRASLVQNQLDGGVVTDALPTAQFTTTLTDGNGADKADALYHDRITLLTTTGETLDLTALVTTFATIELALVKALFIRVLTLTPGYKLEVGAAASNQWLAPFGDVTDHLVLQAGGSLYLESPIDGWAVAGGSKSLKLYNPSGGTIIFDIFIIGEAA